MRRLFIVGLVITGLSLYSCGSNEATDNNGVAFKGYISNAVRPQKTMDGQIVQPKSKTKASTTKEENESKIDTKASSDSKGVGEFTDVDIPKTIDDALASKGKDLFETNCTSCHMTTKQRLVGPGLKGITEIRTPEWILNMITSPMKMTAQDPVAKQLKKEMNGVQMTNMGLSKDEARAVLEYLRKNDHS